MSNPFQRIRDFIARQFSQNGNDYELDGAYGALHPGGDSQRQLYTALDIGTAYAKALIIEVQDDVGVVLAHLRRIRRTSRRGSSPTLLCGSGT